MQDSQYLHLLMHFMHFVNSDERETGEYELAGTFNAARASTIRKGVKRCGAFDDYLGYAACGIGAGLGDVVTNSLEIVGGICRPADAHQPR